MITAITAASVVTIPGGIAWAGIGDWPSYLDGPYHHSSNRTERVVTPANVRRPVRLWHFAGVRRSMPGQPARQFFASPIVVDNLLFIGSNNGWFYKLNATTGAILAKRFLGFQRAIRCPAMGIVTTAAVSVDRFTHQRIVYVAAPDGFLYALRASNLTVRWRSLIARPSRKVNNYFDWSSPTIERNRIYVGVASNCDRPLVRGTGLLAFNKHTGRRVAAFHTLRASQLGGSIWSTAAVGPDHFVYVTTGNAPLGTSQLGLTESIVKLSPQTLRVAGSFTIPHRQRVLDGDFGASPTIFGRHVGACNKNGIFYALWRRTMRLAWERRVGNPAPIRGHNFCIATAAYDGRFLYVGTGSVTIGRIRFRGSVQKLNPVNGHLVWIIGLPNGVISPPTVDGAGVLSVGTYGFSRTPNAVYLIDTVTGRILRNLVRGGLDFGETIFTHGRIYTATANGLDAWGMPRRRRLSR